MTLFVPSFDATISAVCTKHPFNASLFGECAYFVKIFLMFIVAENMGVAYFSYLWMDDGNYYMFI